jgi:flagellar basal-body rod modification protein FlgD
MISAIVNNTASGDQFPTSGSTSNSSSGSSATAANPYNMSPQDFMQLMVTQLQNQDPTQPTSNQDLLAQMSQIGQLESSTQLQTTMQSVTLQTQIGSASSLIGKTVTGVDASNNTSSGVVNSVSVAGGKVSLNLDSGDTMPLTGLASITSTATTNASGTTATTTGTTATTPSASN